MSNLNTELNGKVIETSSGRRLKVVGISESGELICIQGKGGRVEYVPVVDITEQEKERIDGDDTEV